MISKVQIAILCLILVLLGTSCSVYPSRNFNDLEIVHRDTKKKIKIKLYGHSQCYSHKSFLKLNKSVRYDSITQTAILHSHFSPISKDKGRHNSYYLVYYRPIKMTINKADYPEIKQLDFHGRIEKIVD